MKRTENGRVTDEHLDELEATATRYAQPWSMGISSHVLAALIAEVREHRRPPNVAAQAHVVTVPCGVDQACYCTFTGGRNHSWGSYGWVDAQGRDLYGDGSPIPPRR